MEIYVKRKINDRYGIFPGMGMVLFSPFAKIICIALFAAILGTGGFSVFKMFEIKKLELAVSEEQKANILLTGQLDGCNTAREHQNNALIRIRTDAERDVNAVNAVNEKLNNLTKVQKFEISELRRRPAPEGCDASTALLRDNLNTFGEQP